MRYLKWMGGTFAIFLLLSWGMYTFLIEEPQAELRRLLRGDQTVEVKAVRVTGQQQSTFELTDAESIRYLTAAFRSTVREGYTASRSLGVVYTLHLSFDSLQEAHFHIHSGEGETDGVTISFVESGLDPTYFWLPFSQPTPAPVVEMLRWMRKRP